MWDPEQYLRFNEERSRAARDLCARVPLAAPARILDAGCGPGNSTQVLRERWPAAGITGLDSSPEMIARARSTDPAVTWTVGELGTFQAEPFDLVFANAVIQWIPDHPRLLRSLLELVAPGGFLAVQVPCNPRSPFREAMAEAARGPRFQGLLEGAGAALTFHDARFYYEHLAPLTRTLDLWETTYCHVLPDHQGIIDWMASTGMRPYLERLNDPAEQDGFKAEVLKICQRTMPPCPDGRVLMPFQRLFFVGGR